MSARSVVLCGAVVACLAAFASPARADTDASRAPATARPRIVVTIRAGEKDTRALSDLLRELLARIGVDAIVLAAGQIDRAVPDDARSEDKPIATIDIDAPAEGGGHVRVVDAATGRTRVDRAVAAQPSRAVFLDEIAHVVQSDCDTLVDERRARAQPVAAREPPPPPTEPAAASSREASREEVRTGWALDFGSFANGHTMGGESGLVAGVGVAGIVSVWRGPLRPALALLGQYDFPFDIEHPPVLMHVSGGSVRAVPTIRIIDARAAKIDLGIALAIEIIRTTPRVAGPDHFDTTADTLIEPTLGPAVSLRIPMAANIDALAMASADVDIAPHRYVARGAPNGADVLLDPWRVRPSLSIGFLFGAASNRQAAQTASAKEEAP